MSTLVSKLSQLGEADVRGSWPDYLQQGFAGADVAELISVMRDEELWESSDEEADSWAPLHAWRILGQLKARQAIGPMIEMLNQDPDDYQMSELPRAMGLIGRPAIAPLEDNINNETVGIFSRSSSVEALEMIYQEDHSTREEIKTIYLRLLESSSTRDRFLNGSVLSGLITLQATESIDVIREAFAADTIDIGMCGDLEDVEIELGLRTKRETPKPNYAAYHGLDSEPDSDFDFEWDGSEDVDQLDELLSTHGTENSIENSIELEGFLAGMLCSPTLIMPSDWMPEIWGRADHTSLFEDLEAAETFSLLVLSRHNDLIDDLTNGYYSPLYLLVDEYSYDLVGSATYWSKGFARAMSLWPMLPPESNSELWGNLNLILFLMLPDTLTDLPEISDNDRMDLALSLGDQVTAVYNQIPVEPLPSVTTVKHNHPKVGRNDPCPCGSNKKYKKCCLH